MKTPDPNPPAFPPETGHGLYREVPVWRRLDDDCALCYRCLEDLETGLFAVQSVDFHCPGKAAAGHDPAALGEAMKRFVEALLDRRARRASDWGPSLVEAIARHDARAAGAETRAG